MLSRTLAATLLVLGASVAFAAAQTRELVDRVVAIVDRDVILLSEAEQAVRVVALRDGSEVELASVVERLIEARLIERELSRFTDDTPPLSVVAEQVAHLRARFTTEADFRDALARFGLDESELQTVLARQLAVNQYLERRFRSLTQVSTDEIQDYFEEELLPRLEAPREPTSQEVRQIRLILQERKFNRRVDDWIDRLKSRASIRRYVW